MTFTVSEATARVAAQSQRPVGRPGPGVVSLASGDPSFATPEFISQALTDAIAAGYTHYVDGQGDIEFRKALVDRIAKRNAVPVTPQQVLITHGANSGLAAAIVATIDPGDRVLIPEPTYSLYADLVRMVGGTPDFVRHRDNFHLDLEALEARAAGAKMVVLCHPCNPTGVVYRRDELETVARIANEHNLLVLSDEAYDHIVFDDEPFVSTLDIPTLQDRLIYCQTFSKTFAMTGWRLGYAVAPADLIGGIARIHRTLNGPMNSAIQRAALKAVTTETDWPETARAEYEARRAIVLEGLAKIPGLSTRAPEGTFYAFVKYEHAIPSNELAGRALEKGVAIRAGSEYGPSGEGYFRVAFSGAREDLEVGLARLRELFAQL